MSYLNRSEINDEELDFEIIKENWNTYKLNDESKLKARIILTRIFNAKRPQEFGFEFSTPIFVISCPQEKRGERNKEPKQADYDKIPKDEVQIKDESAYEKWNEYKIPKLDKILKIKYSISAIRRLRDRYDNNGYPFYIVTGAPAITIV